jgi:DNA polymerase V
VSSTSSELPRRLALVDVNNFYCSCEAVFNPKLRGKPLVVLSNNDGCVVSRSAEAKALGIKMAQPWHLVSKEAKAAGTLALSSNYTLYGDMSARVMKILGDLAPEQEIYSIDESFLDLTGIPYLVPHGHLIRSRVRQWTGLTVCVGVASTKTRAKLANEIAKKRAEHGGVFCIEDLAAADERSLLRGLPVNDVWGIGPRLHAQLQALGIHTTLDLKTAPAKRIREHFNVVVERIVDELNGTPCLQLESPEPRKQIVSSRSFGRAVTGEWELREAVISYVSSAAEKLRDQGSLARGLQVFVQTNVFKPDQPQYAKSLTVKLPQATDDTLTLARFAVAALRQIYREGFQYKKAGIMLFDLGPAETRQQGLFDDTPRTERRTRLNSTMDRANQRFGRGAVALAGAGIRKGWGMNRAMLSPPYTTSFEHLPEVS